MFFLMFFICRIVVATMILSWMLISVASIRGPKPVRSLVPCKTSVPVS